LHPGVATVKNFNPVRDNFISTDSGIAIMVDCNIGLGTLPKLGKILRKEGHNVLPPWIHVRTRQCKILPKPIALPAPHVGVHFPFEKRMQLTASRILENIPPSQIPNSAVMKIKFGFNGRGSHAIYRQV